MPAGAKLQQWALNENDSCSLSQGRLQGHLPSHFDRLQHGTGPEILHHLSWHEGELRNLAVI